MKFHPATEPDNGTVAVGGYTEYVACTGQEAPGLRS